MAFRVRSMPSRFLYVDTINTPLNSRYLVVENPWQKAESDGVSIYNAFKITLDGRIYGRFACVSVRHLDVQVVLCLLCIPIQAPLFYACYFRLHFSKQCIVYTNWEILRSVM